MSEDTISWSPEQMLEVTIKQPDDFLKVRETLTRIGVASSCLLYTSDAADE